MTTQLSTTDSGVLSSTLLSYVPEMNYDKLLNAWWKSGKEIQIKDVILQATTCCQQTDATVGVLGASSYCSQCKHSTVDNGNETAALGPHVKVPERASFLIHSLSRQNFLPGNFFADKNNAKATFYQLLSKTYHFHGTMTNATYNPKASETVITSTADWNRF